MQEDTVKHLIVSVRQTNGMLQLLDAEKNNPSITLGELHKRFQQMYSIHPSNEHFFFYNQNQFLTSLLAYLCLPTETYYNKLPETQIIKLNDKWGLSDIRQTISLKQFTRRMRNAVSHGHVEVTPELLFEFVDNEFKIKLNHVNLHKFCQALAYWCLTGDESLDNHVL
jgi:hypothetical protein